MKIVEMKVGYDLDKVLSGEVSVTSTDMITGVHIKSDVELLPSERRQFEADLAEVIHKHFIANKRIGEIELRKRKYLVSDVVEFLSRIKDRCSCQDAYLKLSNYDTALHKQLVSGEIKELSRQYILSTDTLNIWDIKELDSRLEEIKVQTSINSDSVSGAAIRHVLLDVLGMTITECRATLGHRYYALDLLFREDWEDTLFPLNGLMVYLRGLNSELEDELSKLMVAYTKENPPINGTRTISI